MSGSNYLKPLEKVFSHINAMEEASRCLMCLDAPCSNACPAGTDPAKFIRSLRFKNLDGAVETIRTNNILGACCSLVCPYDYYCEGACLRTGIDKPIKIGKIQEYLMEYEHEQNLKVLQSVKAKKEKVAIIGGGPAGLTTSASLALLGYNVTIFEKREKSGGWLSYGIPPSRLSQEIVDREISYISNLGVKFKNGVEIGKDVSIDDLKKEGFKTILVSTGLQNAKYSDIPNVDHKDVLMGVDFLARAKSTKGNLKIGNKVVVIGGGDVAVDCAVSAKLLGAQDVKIIYRRKISDMPAGNEEKKLLQNMDIPIFTGIVPKEIKIQGENISELVGTGLNDQTFLSLPCDMIIWAIGQENEKISGLDLPKDSNGNYIENDSKTNTAAIFVAGDIQSGDKTVVNAVANGKKAALAIDKYLTEQRA